MFIDLGSLARAVVELGGHVFTHFHFASAPLSGPRSKKDLVDCTVENDRSS